MAIARGRTISVLPSCIYYSLFFLVETPAPAIYQSDLLQTGTQNPRESLGFFNDTGAPQFVDVMLGRLTGVARTFDMFVICTDCQPITGKVHNFNTTSSSIANNADASGGVMAIGAINAIEPGNDLIASYSSRGPTNDLRNKPDLTAIDGVAVTGSGGFFNPFYGTSAASPHAAAIARARAELQAVAAGGHGREKTRQPSGLR